MSALGFIRMYPSKVLYNVLNPDPDTIHVEDIAHHLSREGRFSNGTAEPYYVGQHSWFVSYLLDKLGLGGWGLFHDGSEAHLRDIASPVKHLDEFGGYRAIELTNQFAIYRKFGLYGIEPQAVHDADHQAFLYEEFLVRDGKDYPEDILVPAVMMNAWSSQMCFDMFMNRYKELKAKGQVK